MTDQVSRWKGNWKEKGDEAKPKWIDPDVWKGLVLFWQDPKSEKRVTTAEMLGIMIRMAKASITPFRPDLIQSSCKKTGKISILLSLPLLNLELHTNILFISLCFTVRRLEKKLLISLSC